MALGYVRECMTNCQYISPIDGLRCTRLAHTDAMHRIPDSPKYDEMINNIRWKMNPVFQDVALERLRQDELFPMQDLPDGTGLPWQKLRADRARENCDGADSAGELTWYHVLDEECKEAFAEADNPKLYTELIQTAAVAIRWAESIRRRYSAA